MIPAILFSGGGAGSAFSVNITDCTVTHAVTSPSAKAGIKLATDGGLYAVSGVMEYLIPDQWLDPNDATEADNYEAIVVPVSGSLSAGTINAYVPLSSDWEWSLSRASFGFSYCTINVKINRIGNRALVLGNATIVLEAEVAV